MQEPLVTLILIVANGLISWQGFRDRAFLDKYMFHIGPIVAGKQYIRFLSSGFLHGSWGHLIFNMLTLYFFGGVVELGDGAREGIGALAFISVYLLSLIGGDMLALLMHRNNHEYRALGASGAVSGILFAAILLFPGNTILLFFVLPVPDWLFAVGYVGYSLYGMKTRTDNIGHEAHLGGAITGALAALALRPQIFEERPVLFLSLTVPVILFLLMYRYLPQLIGMGPRPLFSKKQRFGADNIRYQEKKPDLTIRDYQAELNRLLDKVSKSGIQSLTKSEKDKLDWLSKNLRQKPGGKGERAPEQ